ncbi:DUF2514 family protein [Pseudomonas sp. NPDC078700]|uniref:DUF2514 family protein n=1 Tax=Pseudomonas sp. NPDC078700 TaxID=3364424 RepID=UPI0037C61B08
MIGLTVQRLIAYAVIALALAGAGAWLSWAITDNSWQAKHSEYVAKEERSAKAASDQARSEEQRRQTAIEGIRKDGQKVQAELTADINDYAATNKRLRAENDRVLSVVAKYSGTPAGGKTAESAVVVLGELFKSANERAGELAGALKASRGAGLICERSYDSVKGS